MKLNILIPGGAGYIGSVLTENLLQQGHRVTVFDNFYFRQSSLLHVLRNKSFNLIEGDIRDIGTLAPLLSAADVIIPLASLVGAPICDREPKLAREVNLAAPIEIFKRISDQQMLLMPTTNSAYGSGDSNNFCDENSPLNPISSYAKMKVSLEKALMEKQNSISFRLATVFGVSPRMRLDLLVNDFTFRALQNESISLFEGHFKRNYIHILDVVGAFNHGIANFQKMKGQIYNVGLSSANISKLELCQKIKTLIPNFEYSEDFTGKDPDQRNYIVSNQKIEATGYLPGYTLENGISEIIKAYPLLKTKMKNVE